MGDTQLHLRWHSHGLTFTGMLQDLHHGRAFTDVSLVCDGGVVRAHRAVLSLCSPYLASVLGTCKDSDEAPLLLPEVPVQDIRFLVSFIYKGQVDVPQQNIASFLNTGKHLQVLGLEQGDRLVDSPCKSDGSGASSAGSEGEDDIHSSAAALSTNNNDGEKKQRMLLTEKNLLPINCLKSEIKLEDIKCEAETIDEGKIDLNFYLQQAIQSASMPCPLCKKEFKSQSGLRDHIRLHTGERPFVCDFCHMNFARASHLKRHRRMHTGEKPFECSVCGKDFSRGDKLKDHLRRHEAEDKLLNIRKQILHLDETPDNGDNPPCTSSFSSSASTITTFSAKSPITSLSTAFNSSPHQLLSNKLPGSELMLQPPAKRQCINPKMSSSSLMHPGIGVIPSLLIPQHSENVVPQMLGVTSIGECILRPIN